jgi:hypothetical protein
MFPPLVRVPWFLFGLALLWTSTARAQDGGPGASWKLSVEAGTDFPVSVGARVGAELPYRLRLSTSLGWLPRPYLRAINNVLVEAGAYDEPTADLIENGLQSSLVWRTHVGWRPFAGAGFYIDAGYGLLALGGETRAGEVLVALVGIDLPIDVDELGGDYTVDSLLHMVDVELGWQWEVRERWTVRAAVGGALTFKSAATVEPDFEPAVPAVTNLFTSLAEGELNRVYQRYVRLPVVSLSVGYVF